MSALTLFALSYLMFMLVVSWIRVIGALDRGNMANTELDPEGCGATEDWTPEQKIPTDSQLLFSFYS